MAHTKKAKKHSRAKSMGLEVYAFWTGVASTIISLLQVLIIASK